MNATGAAEGCIEPQGEKGGQTSSDNDSAVKNRAGSVGAFPAGRETILNYLRALRFPAEWPIIGARLSVRPMKRSPPSSIALLTIQMNW